MALMDRPAGSEQIANASAPQDKLTVALQAGGNVDARTLAHLFRFAQSALDEAERGSAAGRISRQRLLELADGLEALGGVIRAHILQQGPDDGQ